MVAFRVSHSENGQKIRACMNPATHELTVGHFARQKRSIVLEGKMVTSFPIILTRFDYCCSTYDISELSSPNGDANAPHPSFGAAAPRHTKDQQSWLSQPLAASLERNKILLLATLASLIPLLLFWKGVAKSRAREIPTHCSLTLPASDAVKRKALREYYFSIDPLDSVLLSSNYFLPLPFIPCRFRACSSIMFSLLETS